MATFSNKIISRISLDSSVVSLVGEDCPQQSDFSNQISLASTGNNLDALLTRKIEHRHKLSEDMDQDVNHPNRVSL